MNDELPKILEFIKQDSKEARADGKRSIMDALRALPVSRAKGVGILDGYAGSQSVLEHGSVGLESLHYSSTKIDDSNTTWMYKHYVQVTTVGVDLYGTCSDGFTADVDIRGEFFYQILSSMCLKFTLLLSANMLGWDDDCTNLLLSKFPEIEVWIVGVGTPCEAFSSQNLVLRRPENQGLFVKALDVGYAHVRGMNMIFDVMTRARKTVYQIQETPLSGKLAECDEKGEPFPEVIKKASPSFHFIDTTQCCFGHCLYKATRLLSRPISLHSYGFSSRWRTRCDSGSYCKVQNANGKVMRWSRSSKHRSPYPAGLVIDIFACLSRSIWEKAQAKEINLFSGNERAVDPKKKK